MEYPERNEHPPAKGRTHQFLCNIATGFERA
jgi:hypothetical protein